MPKLIDGGAGAAYGLENSAAVGEFRFKPSDFVEGSVDDAAQGDELRIASIDRIAQRSGVSKATVYKWWPNRTAVAASSASARDRRAGKELLTGAAASGQVGAHLADRRRVREFLDFRRRVERRVAHPAVWLTAALLHGHTCDTPCNTPVGHQGLRRVLRQRPQNERSGEVMQQLGCNRFPRALAYYRNPYGRMDLWIVVGFLRVR
jgi:hypothetical protein